MDYLETFEVKREEQSDDDGEGPNIFHPFFSTAQVFQSQNHKRSLNFSKTSSHIAVSKTFQSFAEVSEAVRKYECENNVHLAAKYFRRIAANPKPSNKEDFMLSVEERKRFVYRWVDFCCTFFDDRIAQPSEDGETPVAFSVKECPMRIRFQLRTNERDLIVSTCQESHDHCDDVQKPARCFMPVPMLPPKETSAPQNNERIKKSVGDDKKDVPKVRTKKPLPPLNALPANITYRETESEPFSEEDSRPAGITATGTTKKSALNWLPKPPPLKRGVASSTSSSVASTSKTPQNADKRNNCGASKTTGPPTSMLLGVSARVVVSNIYDYLLHVKTEGPDADGIGFLSSHPDLVKITAKMSGMDERYVSQIIERKQSRSMSPSVPSIDDRDQSQNQTQQKNLGVVRKRIIGVPTKSYQQFTVRRNFHTSNLNTIANKQKLMHNPSVGPRVLRHNYNRTHSPNNFSLPLEVIIKSEPSDYNDPNEDEDMEDDSSMNFNGENSVGVDFNSVGSLR